VAFDYERLPDVRKVQVVVEFGGGPDFSGFNPTMIGRRVIDVVRFFSIQEKECDVFKERGLVCLNGEVIVCLTFPYQVIGEVALGKKGIRCDNFTLDIDLIKEGNGHLDLICSLGLFIILSWKGAYFFWV
jgi:hypothetical protein